MIGGLGNYMGYGTLLGYQNPHDQMIRRMSMQQFQIASSPEQKSNEQQSNKLLLLEE